MARSRDGEAPLQPEVVVLDEDGMPVANAGKSVVRAGRRGSSGTRFGALVVIVAVFAFGVVTGRSTIQIRTGAATPATAPPATTTPPAEARTSEPNADQPSESQTATADGESDAAPQTFPELTGICGHSTYLAQVGYVAPLTTPIDMTIVAGSPPRSYDLRSGTAGPPLATLARGEFVSEIAVDEDGPVLAVRSCDNPMVPRILRVTADGDTIPIDIDLPSDARPGTTFVTVDNRIWVPVFYRAYDKKDELLATDGSGDTRSMPPVIDSNSAVISPDGSRGASVELNTDGPAGRHIQITNLVTGETAVLPDIRLGAASAAPVFSPDSRWLVVAVATLAGGRILLYGPDDLRGPYGLPGTISEPQAGWVPVAVY